MNAVHSRSAPAIAAPARPATRESDTESTRLQALENQQQLAVQSLSIANNNDIVLRLF
ncbi:hypothetical protein [Methylosinus trichosporium]